MPLAHLQLLWSHDLEETVPFISELIARHIISHSAQQWLFWCACGLKGCFKSVCIWLLQPVCWTPVTFQVHHGKNAWQWGSDPGWNNCTYLWNFLLITEFVKSGLQTGIGFMTHAISTMASSLHRLPVHSLSTKMVLVWHMWNTKSGRVQWAGLTWKNRS